MMDAHAGAVSGESAGASASNGDSNGAGSEAASESARLKLETPIFVAEALLQAASAQLDIEHKACKKEVRVARALCVYRMAL